MAGRIPGTGLVARIERLAVTGSTNDVVRDLLEAGSPELCVAVADRQTAGRGRNGRRWEAPAGAALLCSLGFRPTWATASLAWRIPASVALAMADAAEEVAGLPAGSVRCKWPNDLVVETAGPRALLVGELEAGAAAARLAAPLELRKLGGILAEGSGLDGPDPRLVVGVGVNADWPAAAFPGELAGSMTSLREASGGRPIPRDRLLDAFLGFLAGRIDALRAGFFALDDWAARQVTTGRRVVVETGSGPAEPALALGIDAGSGALVVDDGRGGELHLHAGEVVRIRLAAAL